MIFEDSNGEEAYIISQSVTQGATEQVTPGEKCQIDCRTKTDHREETYCEAGRAQ